MENTLKIILQQIKEEYGLTDLFIQQKMNKSISTMTIGEYIINVYKHGKGFMSLIYKKGTTLYESKLHTSFNNAKNYYRKVLKGVAINV